VAASKFEEGFYLATLTAQRTVITYENAGVPVRFDTRAEAEAWAVEMKMGAVVLQVRKVSEVVPEMKVVSP
jgi:hypothetical protein